MRVGRVGDRNSPVLFSEGSTGLVCSKDGRCRLEVFRGLEELLFFRAELSSDQVRELLSAINIIVREMLDG